jgi:hypothetical protein
MSGFIVFACLAFALYQGIEIDLMLCFKFWLIFKFSLASWCGLGKKNEDIVNHLLIHSEYTFPL